jgi:tetratricopeptide (TPR) repeat protein
MLSDRLVSYGRPAEALEALRRAEALGAGPGERAMRRLDWALRTDDLVAADRECASLLMTPDPTDFVHYRWPCLIGLRMAGRYREAAELAREARVPRTASRRVGVPLDRVNDALLDFEMGRPLAAAAKYAALDYPGVDLPTSAAGNRARASSWNLARSLTASVAGGDTARARLLVDSLAAIGRHSTFARDSLLHYFVRGLLLARAGNHDAAVHPYRAAMESPAYGYTRINYELARSLIAVGRPAEAVPVLQAVLRGGIQGSGLYLTRTETHELLAHAFERSGQRDSAIAHYTIVERNWRDADPFLRARYQQALASLPPNARNH